MFLEMTIHLSFKNQECFVQVVIKDTLQRNGWKHTRQYYYDNCFSVVTRGNLKSL